MKTYKQLTYALRCQIYSLKKIGISQNEIADQLTVSKSSISRKLSRNTGKNIIVLTSPITCNKSSINAHKAIKMTANLIELIVSKTRI
jgi:IS30 family transposase